MQRDCYRSLRQAVEKSFVVHDSYLHQQKNGGTPAPSPMRGGCCRRVRRRRRFSAGTASCTRVNEAVASMVLLLAVFCHAKVCAEETSSRLDSSKVRQLRQEHSNILTSLSLAGIASVSGRIEARYLQGGLTVNTTSCWLHTSYGMLVGCFIANPFRIS